MCMYSICDCVIHFLTAHSSCLFCILRLDALSYHGTRKLPGELCGRCDLEYILILEC